MAVPSPDLGTPYAYVPVLDPSPYRSLDHLASTAGRYPVPHITPTTRPGHDDLLSRPALPRRLFSLSWLHMP